VFEESLRNTFFCVFLKPNDNGHVTSIVLGSKTHDKKGLISYKIENEILIMKKRCEVEHFDIKKKLLLGLYDNISLK
jgi:hypothetical protein